MARSPASPIHQRPPSPYNLGLFIMFVPDYAVISAICHTATSRCGCCGRGHLPKKWARQTKKNINVLTKHINKEHTCPKYKCEMCTLFCVLRIRPENREKETTVKFLHILDSTQAKTTSFLNALEFTKRHRTPIMSYYASSFDHATSLQETWIAQTPTPFTFFT